MLLLAVSSTAAEPIHLHMDKAGYVSLNLYDKDGKPAGQVLTGKHFTVGNHDVPLSGPMASLPPGNYTWRAMVHDGLSLQLRGWVGDWGGDLGTPSATAAGDSLVYLGWSLTSANGDAVVACDPAGKIKWTHHRGALSGCHALGVDAGIVYVLGGEGADADGGSLYRLNAKDGNFVRWPDGSIDLKIASLWPAGHKDDPIRADYFAVKNGRIYLSFTVGDFTSILDAKTGKYLQTIVGTPSGAVDVTGTQCDTPDKPGVMVDADFLVSALEGGAIGKLLMVHNPMWVIASDVTPLSHDEGITAIMMIGDGAKHHMHDIFVGIGAPYHQVEGRPVLDTDTATYTAGKPGGRLNTGPWQPGGMSFIRSVALDPIGQLWVAEGDAEPKRISVWTTNSEEGRLVRESFAPPGETLPVAINPLDPRLMICGGCEWRIDPATGHAACLGVVSRNPARSARFTQENGHILLVLEMPGDVDTVLERFGDGDYRPYTGTTPAASPAKFQMSQSPDGSYQIVTEGFAIGTLFGKSGEKPRTQIPLPPGNEWTNLPNSPGALSLAQTTDSKVFITAGKSRAWNFELRGLDTLRPLASGTVTVPVQKQ